MGYWRTEAIKEAKAFANEYVGEMVDLIMESKGDIFEDAEHYDANVTDRFYVHSYSLVVAAQLIEELDEFEENESAQWEGFENPREAIVIMAQGTYKNAVLSLFSNIVSDINAAVSAAEGNEFHWTLEQAMDSDDAHKGVLEWRPGQKRFSEFSDFEQVEMEKKHLLKVRKTIEKIVKRTLNGW